MGKRLPGWGPFFQLPTGWRDECAHIRKNGRESGGGERGRRSKNTAHVHCVSRFPWKPLGTESSRVAQGAGTWAPRRAGAFLPGLFMLGTRLCQGWQHRAGLTFQQAWVASSSQPSLSASQPQTRLRWGPPGNQRRHLDSILRANASCF